MNSHNDVERVPPKSLTIGVFALVVFFIALGSFLQATSARGELHSPPRPNGDEESYDRLGYNMAGGLGFGYCPNLATVHTPLARCQKDCAPDEFELTAYRPPGFPFVVAAIYWLSPLNYFLVRCTNCVFLALAVASVSAVFFRDFSRCVGVFVAILSCADPRLREFAGTFMTENMATLMLSIFALAMSRFVTSVSTVNACLCGLALSILTFTRTFYAVWYPVLWLYAAGICLLRIRAKSLTLSTAILTFLLFAGSSVAVIGPWWLRNCVVLHAFMPTGTQGGIGIPDGFSDNAYRHRGNWTSETAKEIEIEMRADPDVRDLKGIEFEKELCRRGMAYAKSWIKDHPREVLQLTWWKISRLWEYGNPKQMGLLALAMLGIFVTRRQKLAQVIFVLIVLNSLTVMATYHTYERFLTPFRPLLNGMAGCGIEWLLSSLCICCRQPSPTKLNVPS